MNDVQRWVLGDADPFEGEVQAIHGTSLVFDVVMQIVVIANNNIYVMHSKMRRKILSPAK